MMMVHSIDCVGCRPFILVTGFCLKIQSLLSSVNKKVLSSLDHQHLLLGTWESKGTDFLILHEMA